LTLLPYLAAGMELKTKPTQHSVKELRGIGIQPDAIICRSDYPVPDSIREKVSLFCDVPGKAVIPLETVGNVYEVPLILEEAGLGDTILEVLDLPRCQRDMAQWAAMVHRMTNLGEAVPIALVGKYVEYPDSYLSVKEALRHAGLAHGREIEIQWIHSEDIERFGAEALLATACGIVVPGGFGPRGVEGMVETVHYARQHQVPYLGLCLGLQVMVIDWARDVLGLTGANSSELDPDTGHPVVHIMEDQRRVTSKGGTMRLGAYPCLPQENTWTMAAYGTSLVNERHRHRFELNNAYREAMSNSGFIVGGISPDGTLVETGEVREHPFMVGVQFHPEFQSRPNRPHPLFTEFLGVAKKTIREGVQRPLPLDSLDGAA
jgi:CTP synthase